MVRTKKTPTKLQIEAAKRRVAFIRGPRNLAQLKKYHREVRSKALEEQRALYRLRRRERKERIVAKKNEELKKQLKQHEEIEALLVNSSDDDDDAEDEVETTHPEEVRLPSDEEFVAGIKDDIINSPAFPVELVEFIDQLEGEAVDDVEAVDDSEEVNSIKHMLSPAFAYQQYTNQVRGVGAAQKYYDAVDKEAAAKVDTYEAHNALSLGCMTYQEFLDERANYTTCKGATRRASKEVAKCKELLDRLIIRLGGDTGIDGLDGLDGLLMAKSMSISNLRFHDTLSEKLRCPLCQESHAFEEKYGRSNTLTSRPIYF
jgi:hypothetical protein